ncbi:MAG: Heparinase family protein [Gammaproteobacteria bacterium]|nr:Heparinase family protein [Gammaproteobacteria bacterium]
MPSNPLRKMIRLIVHKMNRIVQVTVLKLRLFLRCSYYIDKYIPRGLSVFFSPLDPHLFSYQSESIMAIARLHIRHYFNILGSGWLKNEFGMLCPGLEGHIYLGGFDIDVTSSAGFIKKRINRANARESLNIWKNVDENHIPIDWQRDIKSGYRWSEKTWYTDVKYGHLAGVDVKVPWELARMQHLPSLAFAYVLTSKVEYACEFRNQALDFIANNPPQWGVNWSCTMDVAIRIANMLVAYDLLAANGYVFEKEFMAIFERSVYEHGRHISNNLEWNPYVRANHYLADIAGLLFVAAYLPRSKETDTWLLFSVNELINEVHRQFHEDGSNFEASTSYHRLSAEMVIYATALVLRLDNDGRLDITDYYPLLNNRYGQFPVRQVKKYGFAGGSGKLPFPDTYLYRMHGMSEFVRCITKDDGQVPQVGDNDSGRFFKFQPEYRRTTANEAKAKYRNLQNYQVLSEEDDYWDELFQKHEHILAAASGIVADGLPGVMYGNHLDFILSSTLAGGAKLSLQDIIPEFRPAATRIGTESIWQEHMHRMEGISSPQKMALRIPLNKSIGNYLGLYGFTHGGFYVFRNEHLYLLIKCGQHGQDGNGGHDHNDQLAIELSIDGEDVIVDPGTYLYTPVPEARNRYRSVAAHFAPQLHDIEPESLELGLFRLSNNADPRVLYFGEQGFIGTHRGYGPSVYRIIALTEKEITITDYIDGDMALKDIYDINLYPCHVHYSPSYGQVLR